MQQFKRAAFYTLGCKLNFSETSSISKQLVEGGYAVVDLDDRPDVVVINTCSVTDHADKKCRNLVRRALKANADAFVAVVGCYAQLKPEEIAAIPGVSVVLGANEKFNLIEYIENREIIPEERFVNGHIKEVKTFIPSYSSGDRTRSFLKVQDGCDYFCSFCTIPLARGRSRNASVSETVANAKSIAATDIKEIVLTGVNIGDFGQRGEEGFIDLIHALDEVEGIERFRISSIEPNLLTDEIIDFVANSKKFVPHFHIPLQSGSDEMLQAMRRRYGTQLYENRIEHIKQVMPNACIGVDVIVGFPGETDHEFMLTLEFLKKLDVSYLHVFTYSERPNTTAIRMEGVVPISIRQQRNALLTQLSHKKKRAFYASQIGKTAEVLWESENREGFMFGFSENYVKTKAPFNPDLCNTIQTVELEAIDKDGMMNCNVLVEA